MGFTRTCIALVALASAVEALSARADDGLRIEEYVEAVLRSHPAAAAARFLDDGAAAESRAARLLPDPTLELTLGRGRPSDGSAPEKTETGFAVSQVVPWLPARSAAVEAADHGAAALRADATAARQGLALDARLAYLGLVKARALEEVARAAEADARSLLDLVARRAALGESREVDRIRSRVEWLRQERELRAAGREAEAAERVLRTLAAEPLPEPLRLAGALPLSGDAAAALASATPERLASSPALLRAEAEAARAAALASSARRGRVPELGFSFFRQKELDRDAWGGALDVSLPLWNARRGDVARAEADARLKSSGAAAARLSLLAGLEARRRDAETLAGQVASLETDLLPAAAESLRLARLLFEEGETSLLDLLDAQRTAREARREEILARHALAASLAELARLLGPDAPTGENR